MAVSLQHLGLLNPVLDALLLGSPLLRVSPPNWALVFASHVETDTGAAGRMVLITFLPT